jgi:hypothetical protein
MLPASVVGVSGTDSIRLLPRRHSIVLSELVCTPLMHCCPQLIALATDWLCEAHFFDQLIRDERYAEQRLGFNAPNILVMKLETYAN